MIRFKRLETTGILYYFEKMQKGINTFINHILNRLF